MKKTSLFKKITVSISGIFLLLYVVIFIFFATGGQEQMLFPARTIAIEQELNFALEHEELFVETPDGEKLNGVLFSAETPKGIVLHFHANIENILDMEAVAKPFIENNYSFITMDYRTYGKSTGELSEKNLFADASLFMSLLEDRGWSQSDIILYGRSVGTGIATNLASKTNPRGLILHSPYISMELLMSENMPFLPMSMIFRYPLHSAEYMAKVSCPVIILHGDLDELVPIAHAKTLSEVRGELVVIEGGDHENLRDFPGFQAEINEFLETIKL
jgi:alpha-beta hydrolase superfamily lysophospholipase